ncbi:hypothetical protein EPVG_00144 [Emiliania huxleyi virus 201]|nr:hypothetical protein ELVG_00159 [Emiliania huxleyi virus 203]AEP15566.1 hypothetical protein EQVG_00156 [Emiliania huxleyi virus 207]AET98032.1 hypothetical protein EPVG_00144 [Emiliania huxleyi virus 201]
MGLFIALPFIVVSIVILAVISITYFNKRRARSVHMPVIRVSAHNTSPMRRSSANVSRRTSADYDMSEWMSPLVSSGSYARLPGDPLSRRSSTPSLPRYRVSGNSFGEWSG